MAKSKTAKEKKVKTTISIKLLQNDLNTLGVKAKVEDGSTKAEEAFRTKFELETRKKKSKKSVIAEKLGLDPATATKTQIYDAMLEKLE